MPSYYRIWYRLAPKSGEKRSNAQAPRCVFFEDSMVMKWLNQMLDKPGHLTVHFPELIEAMSEVTGTPVPDNLESCFVAGERVEPHDTEEHAHASA